MGSSGAERRSVRWCFWGVGVVVAVSVIFYAALRVSMTGDMLPQFQHVAALWVALQILLPGVLWHATYVLTALNIPAEARQQRRGMSPDFRVTAGLILAVLVLGRVLSTGGLAIGLVLVLAASCYLAAVRVWSGWHWPGTTPAHLTLGLVCLVNAAGWGWWAHLTYGALGLVVLVLVLLPLWELAYSLGLWTPSAWEFQFQCQGGKAGSGRLPQRPALLAGGALLVLSVAGWALAPRSGLMLPAGIASMEKLQNAIERGDLARVHSLLEQRPYAIWAHEVVGSSLLSDAALHDQRDIMALLLERGADVNARDDLNRIALHNTAERGSVDSARLLLDHGSEVNVTDILGCTPLLEAALAGNRPMVTLLLEHGAEHDVFGAAAAGDVDTLRRILRDAPLSAGRREGLRWTPLHVAASLNQAEAARMLIASGADVNARAWLGRTPLLLAAVGGNAAVGEVLLEKGADPNLREAPSGATPLHAAAESGSLPLVKLLLENGADADAKTAEGLTPIMLAELHEYPQIAELLQRYGATPVKVIRVEK